MEMKQKFIEKKKEFLNKCVACDRFTHNVIACPRIHFIPNSANYIVMKERHKANLKANLQTRNIKYKKNRSPRRWKLEFRDN
jgi:hypothetical protein